MWRLRQMYAETYLDLGCFDDWRLPGIKELMYLTIWNDSSSQYDPIFEMTSNENYWSSDSYPKPDSSNYPYLDNSNRIPIGTMSSVYSRCVRGEKKQEKFIDSGNGTVSDAATELTWQQGEGGRHEWEDALSYCNDLPLAGKSDWLLPNLKERLSIVDYSNEDPSIGKTIFPETASYYYWSSTSNDVGTAAKVIRFEKGDSILTAYGNDMNVRCVGGE